MKETFEDKWKRTIKKATEQLKNDKSLKTLQKKYVKLLKRVQRTENEMTNRKNQIFQEEVQKEFDRQ